MENYIARDILEEEEHVEWIRSKVHIPCKLYSLALAQIKVQDWNAKKKNKRVTHTPYNDAILLYGWMQYTYKWHLEEGRPKEEIDPVTTTYIMKGLHWGHKKTRDAIDILEVHKFVERRNYIFRDDEGKITGKQQGLKLVHDSL